jgi:hypothetical protein
LAKAEHVVIFPEGGPRPVLGLAQPPIEWAPGAVSPGVKRQGRETDQSPPSSAKVKNGGVVTPLLMYNRPNMWPQYWGLYEPRGPAKGPNGG